MTPVSAAVTLAAGGAESGAPGFSLVPAGPATGRLVAGDEDADAAGDADLVARDTGIDGGAATAEEAAVHVVEDDDNDIRSGD